MLSAPRPDIQTVKPMEYGAYRPRAQVGYFLHEYLLASKSRHLSRCYSSRPQHLASTNDKSDSKADFNYAWKSPILNKSSEQFSSTKIRVNQELFVEPEIMVKSHAGSQRQGCKSRGLCQNLSPACCCCCGHAPTCMNFVSTWHLSATSRPCATVWEPQEDSGCAAGIYIKHGRIFY